MNILGYGMRSSAKIWVFIMHIAQIEIISWGLSVVTVPRCKIVVYP